MQSCIFCDIISHSSTACIVFENSSYLAFLDKYPKTKGHIQLIPKTHVQWIYELSDMGDFFRIAQLLTVRMIPVLKATHVTYATFGHQVAHAHLWIVPQYRSETPLAEQEFGSTDKEKMNSRIAEKLQIAFETEKINK